MIRLTDNDKLSPRERIREAWQAYDAAVTYSERNTFDSSDGNADAAWALIEALAGLGHSGADSLVRDSRLADEVRGEM